MTFMSYETIQFTEYLMYLFTSGKRSFTKQFFFKDTFFTCHMDVGEKLLPTAIS